MSSSKNFQFGLLYLIHLLTHADGSMDDHEITAINEIRNKEKISDAVFEEFKSEIIGKKEKVVYDRGIELIKDCTDEERLRAFVHLYKLSEVDGRVHVKEVRLLLYSIKMAGLEFNDVVKASQA